ncbi:hypothetical protein [Nonomuraea gerenzanensis]|uniref:Uncharacterized protein n=1 Tax=Nonomuraea gerenzanensis TaxID=93944 RepID=A0A1M4EA59_9ACTN|nr:hypothetical protein [Nonomuraea gerenzanensis]UBU17815.1 hypothetical protein LCN96_23155 [Nonomuraea gerenzanensis]SBO95598.1 hypothetical protein BN4615_P5114 [Nonomuraea gerenzanensis]
MPHTGPAPVRAETLTLSIAPYGDLRLQAHPNPAAGTLRCLARSTFVTGVFLLEPAFDGDNPDPATTRLHIHYGDELPAGAHTGTYRPHRPLIDGTIRLADSTTIDTRTARDARIRIYHRDATSSHRRARVPAPIARRIATVIAALATYWSQRPDADQLRHAAARTLLQRIGLDRKHATIAELEALIADRQRELAEQRAQLARMTALLADDSPPAPSQAA